MIKDDLKGQRVTVAGLGRFGGGIAAARWLCERRARVLVTDTSTPEGLAASLEQLKGLDIEYRLGGHVVEDFTGCDLVVASPAIAPSNPYLRAAREAKVPVTTEIRLFVERCHLPVVAVSGTKGKSTTSKLLALMLETKYKVHLGGNIGKSLLFDLPQMKEGTEGAEGELVLLELSSFMLEYLGEIQWAPHVSVLTMLDCDHLEWHGTREAYLNAKRNLVRYQKRGDIAVLGGDCAIAREFSGSTAARVVWYSMTSRPRFALTIPGEHNQLNAQAAFAAAECLGISWEAAQEAIGDFRGLPHRLELVHQHGGIAFYNDSIATIPNAAAAALEAFPAGKVIQIVGGHDKQLSYDRMSDAIAARAKAMLVIGDAAPLIMANMKKRHPQYAEIYELEDLAAAMRKARELARPGDVVLLSTGCASYGQFANFEVRGQKFAGLAKELFK